MRQKTVAKRLQSLGWYLTHTGGNCTAWRKDTGTVRHLLLTLVDDPIAPTRLSDSAVVRIYRNNVETTGPHPTHTEDKMWSILMDIEAGWIG